MSTAFAAYIAGSLPSEWFTFVDVGCSGGIDPAWRIFGDRLRAVAFDASVDECERLSSLETHPNVRYIAGFVGLPHDHPFASVAAGKPRYVRNPFPRFSAGRMAQINQERLKAAPLEEKLLHNAWDMTRLADPATPIIVPRVLDELGWSDIDFIKIDIDGPDFEVLHSMDDHVVRLDLLAARLEVNLVGGADAWEHAFHNTDRLMREWGFELLSLDVRNYSMSALPSPFAITAPAQTVSGRPFQAEAFYARDPVGPDWQKSAAAMSAAKLAKLAVIFSVWGQPDSAAELLIAFRGRLENMFDVDLGLELLAGQAQVGACQALPYAQYIEAFERGDVRFFPASTATPPSMCKPAGRLAAAWRAFKNPADLRNTAE